MASLKKHQEMCMRALIFLILDKMFSCPKLKQEPVDLNNLPTFLQLQPSATFHREFGLGMEFLWHCVYWPSLPRIFFFLSCLLGAKGVLRSCICGFCTCILPTRGKIKVNLTVGTEHVWSSLRVKTRNNFKRLNFLFSNQNESYTRRFVIQVKLDHLGAFWIVHKSLRSFFL